MRIFFITVLVAFSVGSIILAQPRETADFNHRGEAMAGCDATIDGEGNALDIYDISDGNNPAASHHNEGYGLFGGRIDKLGGADRFSLDLAFRALEYPGPPADNGDDRSWYWIDGIGRIMVDKCVSDNFSMRFNFRGGYDTMRKSFWGEYRHNYSAAVLDWTSIGDRAITTGATAALPIGEFYGTFHAPFGLSIGAGGGYGFSEFEDLYYYSGWRTLTKGNMTSYRGKFGLRYAYPDYAKYGAVGMHYNLAGGTLANEEGNDYNMAETNDNRFGFQAEAAYPGYLRGAFGYESAKYSQDDYEDDKDEDPTESEDKVSTIAFKAQAYGDEIGAPLRLGFRYKSVVTEGETDSGTDTDNFDISKTDMGVGLSGSPIEGMTFAAEYKIGSNSFVTYDGSNESEGTDKWSGFAFATEIYPIREFGFRVGFEQFEHEPDSTYTAFFGSLPEGDGVYPFYMPAFRFGVVPDVTKGSILSGGFVLCLDDDRLQVELTGKYCFASEPQIYKDEDGNRYEGYFGMTYFLH